MGKLLPEVGLPQQGAELFHHQMQTNITAFNGTCGTTELLNMMGENRPEYNCRFEMENTKQ